MLKIHLQFGDGADRLPAYWRLSLEAHQGPSPRDTSGHSQPGPWHPTRGFPTPGQQQTAQALLPRSGLHRHPTKS